MMAKRLVPLAVAASLAAISLSGCAQAGTHAAVVGKDVVTTSDVAFLTRMQCDALDAAAKDPSQAGQVTATPTRLVRAQMVNALVQADLNAQLGAIAHVDYDRATYRQVMNQFEPAVQAVAPADRTRFRDLVGTFYKGQLEVFALAQKVFVLQGVTKPTDTQIQNAVAQLQDRFRKSVTVKINPVYGPDADFIAGAVEPSLSIPVSSFAKDASAGTPNATFVSGLPTNQRCG